jgi:DNA-binding transcriptional MocR family regulator
MRSRGGVTSAWIFEMILENEITSTTCRPSYSTLRAMSAIRVAAIALVRHSSGDDGLRVDSVSGAADHPLTDPRGMYVILEHQAYAYEVIDGARDDTTV